MTLIVNCQEGRDDWICQTTPCGKELRRETWKISGHVIASFVTSGGKMGIKKWFQKKRRMSSDKELKTLSTLLVYWETDSQYLCGDAHNKKRSLQISEYWDTQAHGCLMSWHCNSHELNEVAKHWETSVWVCVGGTEWGRSRSCRPADHHLHTDQTLTLSDEPAWRAWPWEENMISVGAKHTLCVLSNDQVVLSDTTFRAFQQKIHKRKKYMYTNVYIYIYVYIYSLQQHVENV